jgi:hypothetical protein
MSTGADISPSPFLLEVSSINIQLKFNLQKIHPKNWQDKYPIRLLDEAAE